MRRRVVGSRRRARRGVRSGSSVGGSRSATPECLRSCTGRRPRRSLVSMPRRAIRDDASGAQSPAVDGVVVAIVRRSRPGRRLRGPRHERVSLTSGNSSLVIRSPCSHSALKRAALALASDSSEDGRSEASMGVHARRHRAAPRPAPVRAWPGGEILEVRAAEDQAQHRQVTSVLRHKLNRLFTDLLL